MKLVLEVMKHNQFKLLPFHGQYFSLNGTCCQFSCMQVVSNISSYSRPDCFPYIVAVS